MSEKELEKILKALANKRRLLILRLLKHRKSVSVGDIARHIKLSIKATSKHLSILYSAGIVEREQISLSVLYSFASNLSRPTSHILSIL